MARSATVVHGRRWGTETHQYHTIVVEIPKYLTRVVKILESSMAPQIVGQHLGWHSRHSKRRRVEPCLK